MNRLLISALAPLALSVTAGAAAACPDYQAWGASHAVTGPQMYSRVSYDVTAGGGNALTACGFSEEGYVVSAPDFTFDLSQMQGYALQVRVVSECDAVLLVNAPNAAWYYDDDSNGNLDPAVWLDHPGAGYLDVWVGTYDGSYCDAEVTLETF